MRDTPFHPRFAPIARLRGALLCVALAVSGAAQAADDRFAQAQAAFAEGSASGDGEHPGYNRAGELWRALAEEGDSRARYHLGILHMYGLGDAEFDRQLAVSHVRAAAEGGYPMAQSLLGFLIEGSDGTLTISGDAAALEWWRKGAEGGHCTAVRRMARAYGNGELGLIADAAQAAAWAAREGGCSKN